ncbi:Ribosomal protein L11 methylase [Serratia ficaria]|uniref:Ribosomal protein L11 methylase n=2 Tax=Serratia ficaria TaxID=61651 RepID=A0A240C3U0_SERFI|nr:methyltransferase family protein [Serratia ficaria]CAI0807541.1 Ribosomal protein L11 methylase [Serratia ficaria]CAI0814317.1 Ribosomal protein L11 methylase [Serratia ficaria]CAI0826988.1 Ribosomal protein L11 methylase [Serratia ficaria]CAI1860691.1 Ribosomal protein L11 methylase [Serratia ficaria]
MVDRNNPMSENNHEPQFDSLAPLYEDMANWPFRKEIEIPAVLTRLGDLCGLRILDFGCGSGHYSRLLKAKGAERVVGYDVAGGMLHYALEREAQERRGIEYASDLRGFESQFDLVLGVYVLPYAATREQLSAMVRSMVALLRPGGRLLTLPLNPAYAPQADYYAPYGFRLTTATPHQEGSEVHLHLPVGDRHVDITAWYWSRETLTRTLQQSGLSEIQWHAPHPPNPASASPSLDAYLQRPHTMLVDSYYHGSH